MGCTAWLVVVHWISEGNPLLRNRSTVVPDRLYRVQRSTDERE